MSNENGNRFTLGQVVVTKSTERERSMIDEYETIVTHLVIKEASTLGVIVDVAESGPLYAVAPIDRYHKVTTPDGYYFEPEVIIDWFGADELVLIPMADYIHPQGKE